MNRLDLQGRRAVVTGAAQGIGFATAQRLVASGARVAVWDTDVKEGKRAAMELGEAVHIPVDVSDAGQVSKAVEATTIELGGIDVLVNNAGIAGPNAPTWEYPLDQWRRVLAIDLDGVFYCCREIVPLMIEHGYGRIVNVASIAGKEGNPNASAYSAAKAGVIALTKSLGKELAEMDISVNCVTPAAAKTRIFNQMSQAHINYMLSKIPRKRFLEVGEAASLIAWLASEENSFTTGAVFDLSGGRATY